MTTRRDFLKSFAALASGLALAPASALASVQRLGTPAEWVDPDYVEWEVRGVRVVDKAPSLTGKQKLYLLEQYRPWLRWDAASETWLAP